MDKDNDAQDRDVPGKMLLVQPEQAHQHEVRRPTLQPEMEPLLGSQEGGSTMPETTTESDEDEIESYSSEYYDDDTSFFTNMEFDPDLEFLEGEDEFSDEMEEDDIDPDDLSYEELLELGEAVGKQSCGLALEDIPAALFPYFRQSVEYKTYIDRCVVCQVEYEEQEELVALQCGHPYHSDCISQWLQIKKKCPICSMEVTPTERSRSSK